MLSAFGMAFKTPELRKKIFFTLSIMALFRFGSVVPTPGVSYSNVQQCLAGADQGGLGGLSGVNLASRKLPQPCQRFARRPLRQKHTAFAVDQRNGRD